MKHSNKLIFMLNKSTSLSSSQCKTKHRAILRPCDVILEQELLVPLRISRRAIMLSVFISATEVKSDNDMSESQAQSVVGESLPHAAARAAGEGHERTPRKLHRLLGHSTVPHDPSFGVVLERIWKILLIVVQAVYAYSDVNASGQFQGVDRHATGSDFSP